MKRLVVFILSLTMLLFMFGCNKDENEASAFDLGVEALENENVEDAKEQFELVSDEDEDQAVAYMELIESAELIDQSIKSEDYEVAVDTYHEIKMADNFSKVTFIFADEEQRLKEKLDESAGIDGKINALMDFFNPDDPEMSANELYLLKSEELLESNYLTSQQETLIKEFQEAVQKKIDEIEADKNVSQGDRVEQEEKEEENQQEQVDDEKGKQEKADKEQQDKEENVQPEKDKPSKDGNGSKVLTHEEAKEEVLKYLYGNNIILEDTIEDGNFRLDYDHDESGKYVFQLYEIVKPEGEVGHTATVGWYAVDPKTGEVTDNM